MFKDLAIRERVIALSLIDGLGYKTLGEIISLYRENNDFALSCKEVISNHRNGKDFIFQLKSDDLYRKLDYQLTEISKRKNSDIITSIDGNYSPLLLASPDNPHVLYRSGEPPRDDKMVAAVIGSRYPTKEAEKAVYEIVEQLASEGYSILSGLALGVDSMAHRAALHFKAHTIAVLGHSLEFISPVENTSLYKQILNHGGMVVSEFPFPSHPRGRNFIIRDKTQAGLSIRTYLIQSAERGGSLHCSRACLKYGRDLYVKIPSEIDVRNREDKIRANEIILGDNKEDKIRILHCKDSDLERIFPI